MRSSLRAALADAWNGPLARQRWSGLPGASRVAGGNQAVALTSLAGSFEMRPERWYINQAIAVQ